jgi:competence protein ComGF
MLKKKNAFFLNNQAFTLVETLFAFSIFTMMIFFISPVFHIILNNTDLKERLQIMEWEVFCSQIKKEIRMSKNAEVVAGNLILTKDTQTVIYEKYNTALRRRVNNSGHEILLQNVSIVTFTLINHAISVYIKSLSGREFSITITLSMIGIYQNEKE